MQVILRRRRDGRWVLRVRGGRRFFASVAAVCICLPVVLVLAYGGRTVAGAATLRRIEGLVLDSALYNGALNLPRALRERIPTEWTSGPFRRPSDERSLQNLERTTVRWTYERSRPQHPQAFPLVPPAHAGQPQLLLVEENPVIVELPGQSYLLALVGPPQSMKAGSSRQPKTADAPSRRSATREPRRERPRRVSRSHSTSSYEATREGSARPRSLERSHPAEMLGGGIDRADEWLSRIPGLQLKRVTLFQGYSSNAIPRLSGVPSSASELGSDVDIGAVTTFAWQRLRPRSSLSFEYTPSIIRRLRNPEWNSTNHVLSLLQHRDLSRRWKLAFSGRAANQGLEQFFFNPPVLRRVEDPPASMEELAELARRGELSDDELAAVLTGAPVVDSPGHGETDLSRVVSFRTGVTALYRHSRRLKVTSQVAASGYQARSGERSDPASSRLLLQRTRTALGETGMEYKLSPHTSVGTKLAFRKSHSDFRQGDYTTAVATIKRRISPQWSFGLQGGAGGARLNTRSSPSMASASSLAGLRPTWVVGGDLDYRSGSHSISLSGVRDAGDPFGLGARTSLSGGVRWRWRRPGSDWGLRAEADLYRSQLGPLSGPVESRFVSVGLVRRAGRQNTVTTEYSFGSYSAPFTGVLTNLSRHRVQISFQWRPQGAAR